MDLQQRQYYDAMRRSQDQQNSMRGSNSSAGSGSAARQPQYAPSGGSTYSQQLGQSGGSSRGSQGQSRGSQDSLRMSSGPEMAGVGIFFQQEPNSGKVYVANIVPSGSADRSGVIREGDVIVKVDEQDVQGQPLSTLRNLILGKQGSYVVLAFRRMTGTELYYFDVELLRGTPEYFESLKKNQAIAEEKEKLINQVRQQEAEIHQLKHATNTRSSASSITSASASASSGPSVLQRESSARTAELRLMEEALRTARGDRDNSAMLGKVARAKRLELRERV